MTQTISQLRKEAKLAPKYVLQLDGLGLYLSDKQGLTGCNITDNIKKARMFSVGFDQESAKEEIWTAIVKKQCNNKNMKFDIVYL